jgi:hypothetical protein
MATNQYIIATANGAVYVNETETEEYILACEVYINETSAASGDILFDSQYMLML